MYARRFRIAASAASAAVLVPTTLSGSDRLLLHGHIYAGKKRDKASLDMFWLKDESLDDSANLPAPDVIAADVAEDLQSALEQFAAIAEDVKE